MGTSLQKNKPSCGEVKPPFQIRDPYNEVCFCGQGHIQGGKGAVPHPIPVKGGVAPPPENPGLSHFLFYFYLTIESVFVIYSIQAF